MIQDVKFFSLLPVLIALGLPSIVFFLFFRSTTRTLRKISEVAEQTAKGDFSRRLFSTNKDELGDLSRAVSDMGISLEKKFSELQNEKNQLMTVLNGMMEGVLVTNEIGETLLINPALQSMLCLKEPYLGKTLLECLRNKSIYESIEKALREGKPNEQEIAVQLGTDEKSFILHVAPLHNNSECVGSVSVFYDVTDLRRLENMRKEFIANVSHELKTPLTNIRGYAETLHEGAIEDQEVARSFVGKIEHSAKQLQNLVEDILQLSEIESGRMEMDTREISLQKLVEEIQGSFAHSLKTKKLHLKNKIPNDLIVSTNPRALRQILVNLLDNAIKYTPEHGHILLETESQGTFCKVSVIDTGTGIPKKDLPRIFERFYRVDRVRSREMGGTGLGLAIVKHLVHSMGGEIKVTSQINQGSRFAFTIPFSM